MVLSEECQDQFIEAIVTIVEQIERDALKKEKGSLDKEYKDNVRIVARSYLRLSEELLDKEGAMEMARYLYFDFEKPISEYLGFTMPKMLPY